MKGLKTLGIMTILAVGLIATALAGTLSVGDKVPNFTLTNQNGGKTSLSDFAGKGVVLSFLYTKCPDPRKCPMIRNKLQSLASLSGKIGASNDLEVLAITIDPEHDTPEVLKSYAQGFDKDHDNWMFLTGDKDEVAKVAGAFGVIYWDEKGAIQHNVKTIFIGRDGRVETIKSGSDWKPGEFAAEIEQALSQKK